MACVDTVGAAMCVVCPLPSAGKGTPVKRGRGRQDETCSSIRSFLGAGGVSGRKTERGPRKCISRSKTH